MKTILLAAALMVAALSASAFAADTPSAKPAMMHKMKPHTPVIKPAREPSTDQLNQQQLDMHKS